MNTCALVCVAILVLSTTAATTADETGDHSNRGQMLFERHYCEECHGDSTTAPGTMALKIRYGPKNAALLQRNFLPVEYIKFVVRNGFGMMPPFRVTELSEEDLDILANFIISSSRDATASSTPTENTTN